MLLNRRDPIALHWPVIEFAPVPGRPMFPVISAIATIACASRTPSWLWLTPIVHQNDTRSRSWIVVTSFSIAAAGRPVASAVAASVYGSTAAANASKPLVCRSMKPRSIQPRVISRFAMP